MITSLKDLSGLLMYVVTGLVALVLAAFLSTQFVGKAISQTTAPVAPAATTATKSEDIPPPPPPDTGAAEPPAAGTASTGGASSTALKTNPLADIIEDYTYTSQGKRDPFMPFEKPHVSTTQLGPLWPLQRFDLDQLKLVGIIWDVKSPKAMILDPTGKGYVVTVNERIGRNNGYIARIREGEIVVVESFMGGDGKLSYQTKLVKIQTE